MSEIIIETVQEAETGWIVNGARHVPDDPDNREGAAVRAWIADGNAPDPMTVPTPPSVRDRLIARLRGDAEYRAAFFAFANAGGLTAAQALAAYEAGAQEAAP